MSDNRFYEFGQSTDSLVEQIISIREYRAVNRYAPNDRTTNKLPGKIHGKTSLPDSNSDSLKRPDSPTEPQHHHSSNASNSSSEFFDRFYIHDHIQVKNCQAKFKSSFSSSSSLTSTHNSSNSENVGSFEHDKAEIYELNTHQIISLKGIRVNHKV